MKRYLGILTSLVAALILNAGTAAAQVTAGALTWQRELAPALAEAKKSGKAILAFFADSRSDASQRAWTCIYDRNVVPVVKSSFVPLLVDCTSQKSLASGLGVSQPGTAVVYDSQGRALRLLAPREMGDPAGVQQLLKSLVPGGPAAAGTGAPSLQPNGQPKAPPASVSSGAFAEGAIPADQVRREQLGQELTVTGSIVIVEPSTGPRFPFILTLTQRATDPVQVVYWEQTAAKLHAGRAVPRQGEKVTVKGKLTDYRGRLQIKVTEPEQLRFQ